MFQRDELLVGVNMKKLLCVVLVIAILWANTAILARAFIPFDPKMHLYIDRGDTLVPLTEVLKSADSASSQFHAAGTMAIVLNLAYLTLIVLAVFMRKKQSV
jgi:hypothetical protein